jgi:hypothetical protein
VNRAITERPRLAAITALGLAGLVVVGLVLGLLLGGSDDSRSQRAERSALRQVQEKRAAAVELETELEAANARAVRFEQAAGTQRSRAESWRQRAQRAERRSRQLRRALGRARAQAAD